MASKFTAPSANKSGGKYTPPAGREHPPGSKAGKIGGIHNAGKIHNISGVKKETQGRTS